MRIRSRQFPRSPGTGIIAVRNTSGFECHREFLGSGRKPVVLRTWIFFFFFKLPATEKDMNSPPPPPPSVCIENNYLNWPEFDRFDKHNNIITRCVDENSISRCFFFVISNVSPTVFISVYAANRQMYIFHIKLCIGNSLL